MIARMAEALHHVRRFRRGEINALELERALLDEGWTDITFQKRHVWAKYLNIPYLLEE